MSDQNKTITVQKVLVEVSQPYAEGHTITAAEAAALNQVRAENLRNNTAPKIKELVQKHGDAEKAQKEAQKLVSEYDKTYEFSLSSGGGRSSMDPLEREARTIAKAYITAKIKEQGMTQKEYKEQKGDDAITKRVDELWQHEKVIELARKRLAEKEELVGDLD